MDFLDEGDLNATWAPWAAMMPSKKGVAAAGRGRPRLNAMALRAWSLLSRGKVVADADGSSVRPAPGIFFSNEPNEPPHVHVNREDSSAKFWLVPVALVRNFGFSRHELADLERLIWPDVDEGHNRPPEA